MKTRAWTLSALTTIATFALAAGCSGGSGSTGQPAGSGYTLDNGSYQYTATQAQPNTCWSPSKNVPPLPMSLNVTVTVNGSAVVVTTTAGGTTSTFNLTRSGNALTGASSGDADLNPNGVDCVLHIDATFDGNMTANDAFDATQVINISEKSGTACGLLIGTVSNYQFDTLPCSLTTSGHALKQ